MSVEQRAVAILRRPVEAPFSVTQSCGQALPQSVKRINRPYRDRACHGGGPPSPLVQTESFIHDEGFDVAWTRCAPLLDDPAGIPFDGQYGGVLMLLDCKHSTLA